jgi:hypothetical protein
LGGRYSSQTTVVKFGALILLALVLGVHASFLAKHDYRKQSRQLNFFAGNGYFAPLKIAAGVTRWTPKTVTPECFNRGSSPNSAWIPAKSMRE